MDDTRLIGLMVALGGGLLIGLERERRKGHGPDRQAAGVRTFTLAASGGALAQWLSPPLVWIGAVLVAALAALSYFKSRTRDPGLTTEIALFITYLIGVSAVSAPALGAACAVAVAAVLAARSPLHRFATQVLSEQELHDGLLLLGFGLVVIPLVPPEPLPWLGGLGLRPLAGLVWLLLLMQGMAHVALRLLGPRLGLAAAGFLMGFASSSATVAAMGARARRQPAQAGALAVAAVLSTAATWALVPVIAAPFSTAAAGVLLPAAAGGALGALVVGAVLGLAARRDASPLEDGTHDRARALSLTEALVLAGGLMVVTLVMTAAQQRFGTGGAYTSAAVSGLADAHAAVAPLSGLFEGRQLTAGQLLFAVCLSILFNSGTRTVIALVAGGWRYALRVVLALLVGNLCAWSAAWLSLRGMG
ncbi:DUF4010 domain-containing protein [Rhizobacter sp. J219]|uniref:DUF4010 domain-containing protein n=1 Tax=Rhizobacter sp. J219 TaxID=2898430 RepID=UPI0021510FC9|nr:DUF4010 domain-containing protein [Rhizobacter sp. J219]MCR5883022.1 DUF4010 domain-containing protein [Rhizobacter sp. J219]